MKVHTTETQPQFKPVTLHIEIESQEELKILSKLFKYDVSVPEEVLKMTNLSKPVYLNSWEASMINL